MIVDMYGMVAVKQAMKHDICHIGDIFFRKFSRNDPRFVLRQALGPVHRFPIP